MHNNQRGSQGYSIFQSQYSNNGYSAQDAVQYHGNTNNSNSFVPSNNMHLKKNNYSEGHPYPNSQDISNQNHNQVYHSAGGSNGANDAYNGGHTGRAEGYSQNYNEGVVPHQMQFHQQPSPAMHMQGMQHAYYNNQTTSRSNERFSQEISKSYSGHGDGFEAPYVVEPVYVSSRSFDNRDPSIVSHSPMHSVTASRDSNDRYDPQGLHSYSHLLPHTTSSQSSYEYSSGNYPNHGIQAQLQPYPQTQATIPGSHPPNQQYYGRSVHMSVNPGNVNLGLNNNGGRYRSNPNPSSNYNHQSQYGSGAQGRQGQNNGSTMQGRSLNKMLLDILRDRVINTFRLNSALENTIEKFDCVNIATLLFHTGKKKITLNPGFIGRIAARLNDLSEELRAREASNALYGLRCMSSDCPEVRQLCVALAAKLSTTTSKLVAQAVGNAVYGLQSMTSDHEEVRVLLSVLAVKVSECVETLEAQNVGNALYGLRGMNSDHKEVRDMLTALTPKLMSVRESLNGQAIGNSLYGLQSMCSKEAAVREILRCLANLINDSGDSLNAQEIGNCLYGMKRMFSDAPEVRMLIGAIATKVRMSGELLDAQAVGNALYGLQNMKSNSEEMLYLLDIMATKIAQSPSELDGQSMGNAIYGMQGMSSKFAEVRAVVMSLTDKINSSSIGLNAQELGNSLYGLQNMKSDSYEVQDLMRALTRKIKECRHDLASQEIGNALFGMQEMTADAVETRMLLEALSTKILSSKAIMDPQGVGNAIYGLKNMSGDYVEVLKLVEILVGKVQLSWKSLSNFQISNCFCGLQSLSSVYVEVRALLKVLADKLSSCADLFTPGQLVNALYGLRRMYSCHDEVLEVVSILSHKIKNATASCAPHMMLENQFTFEMLCCALEGLQGMSTTVCSGSNEDGCPDTCSRMHRLRNGIDLGEQGQCNPVEDLLQSLADLYVGHNPNWNSNAKDKSVYSVPANHIHNALYALQRMRCETSPAVCRILEIMQPFVEASLSIDSNTDEYNAVADGDSIDMTDKSIIQELSDCGAHICLARAVFGCQGLDGHLPYVHAIQKVYCSRVVRIVAAYDILYKQYEQSKSQRDEAISTPGTDEALAKDLVENYESIRNLAENSYGAVSQLFQYCTLGLHSGCQFVMMDSALQDCYMQQLATVEALLEAHYADFHSAHFKMSEVENHFALCLGRLLQNGVSSPESSDHKAGKFDMSLNNLLFGFNSAILVVFQPSNMQSNSVWIDLEVDPELDFICRPDRMWFASRRCAYLQDYKNVSTVSRVSASDIAGQSSDVLCDLICENFVTLFGPNVEIPAEVSSRLNVLQFQRRNLGSHSISRSRSHEEGEILGEGSRSITKDFADNMFVINLPPEEPSHVHHHYSYDLQAPTLQSSISASDDMLMRHFSNDSFHRPSGNTPGLHSALHSESFSIGSPLPAQYLTEQNSNHNSIRKLGSCDSNHSNGGRGHGIPIQPPAHPSFQALLPGSPTCTNPQQNVHGANANGSAAGRAGCNWGSFDREDENAQIDHKDVISRLSSLTEDAADSQPHPIVISNSTNRGSYNSTMPPLSPPPMMPYNIDDGHRVLDATNNSAITNSIANDASPLSEEDQISLLEAQLEQARLQEQIIQLKMKKNQAK